LIFVIAICPIGLREGLQFCEQALGENNTNPQID
jgi:hypothetical protein